MVVYLIERQRKRIKKQQRGMRKIMKRRILSILGSAVLLCGVITVSTANVSASERELEQVDGSYLTTEEKSTGYISSVSYTHLELIIWLI